MKKTNIEWCDSTWNPVTGCLHNCEYCYARKTTKRFGKEVPDHSAYSKIGLHYLDSRVNDNPYPYLFEPTLHAYRLDDPSNWTKPRTISVCSMADLFGEWVPDEWIEEVFAACKRAPQHRYLFLTKNPNRYCDLAQKGKLPDAKNLWFGSTATNTSGKLWRDYRNTFLSIEPILADFERMKKSYLFLTMRIDWIVIGSETGNRKNKVIPRKEWVDNVVRAADRVGIPVFMKDSLIQIVGKENMRREFPWECAGGGRIFV